MSNRNISEKECFRAPGRYFHRSSPQALRPHDTDAAAPLQLQAADTPYAYVNPDLASPPMVQWDAGGSCDPRAWRGENLFTWGIEGTNNRRHMVPLPATGLRARLKVAASALWLEGATLTGMASGPHDVRATWDTVGRTPGDLAPLQKLLRADDTSESCCAGVGCEVEIIGEAEGVTDALPADMIHRRRTITLCSKML